MQETSCPNQAYITDLLERSRKLREAGQRLIQEADSLWMLARSARRADDDHRGPDSSTSSVP
jgi:hypothetical protein